jgi:hypothetical protein
MKIKNFIAHYILWKKCYLCFFILCLFILPKFSFGLDKELFLQMLKEPTPSWMDEQIQSDLKPFKNKLSSNQIDEWYRDLEGQFLLRVKITDRKIQVTCSKNVTDPYQEFMKGLYLLNDLIPLPDVDFLLYILDRFFPSSPKGPVPIFIISKEKFSSGGILFPDWDAINGYPGAKKIIMEGNNLYSWNNKIEKMFWRGASSGINSLENWKSSQRPKLVLLSLENPDFLDAKITFVVTPSLYPSMLKAGMLGDFVSMKEHAKYKYLIDVDGWVSTWPRCYQLLLSNSVMLKQEDCYIQWFYRGIIPYEHYVPIANDLSDIFEQFKWAKENDILVENIAKNATDFANVWLSHEGIFVYLYKLLEEYAKLQQSSH